MTYASVHQIAISVVAALVASTMFVSAAVSTVGPLV
jgi:hypothetical protein